MVRSKRRMLIDSAWLIRVLAISRGWHSCDHCGSRMFVKAASGLCPVCFERQRKHHRAVARVVEASAPHES